MKGSAKAAVGAARKGGRDRSSKTTPSPRGGESRSRPRGLSTRDANLAAGLGLSLKRLRGLLSEIRPARRGRDTHWYRWSDIAAVLESKAMWAARREAREALRRRVTGSRYWVDGYPHLVSQWDMRNELLPHQVSHGSHRKVWWKCRAGPTTNGAQKSATAPVAPDVHFAPIKKVSVTNSLATWHPDIAAQWHPTKNKSLKPDHLIRAVATRVWWKCPVGQDHEWLASVRSRTARGGRGCPFCCGQRASRAKSLAWLEPKLAREWARDRNSGLTPLQVTSGSGRRVWWRCPAAPDHIWMATVANRVARRSGCPFCAGARVTYPDSLASKSPRAARLWDETKNGARRPTHVSGVSLRYAWWRCRHGHVWKQSIRSLAREPSCPECKGRPRR